jgi:DNA-binding response OmpR family regulator
VLDALAARPSNDRPLILVITAGTEPRNLNADLVAGTIHKPFDVEVIVDTIAAAVATFTDREQGRECPPADSEMGGLDANPRVNG